MFNTSRCRGIPGRRFYLSDVYLGSRDVGGAVVDLSELKGKNWIELYNRLHFRKKVFR